MFLHCINTGRSQCKQSWAMSDSFKLDSGCQTFPVLLTDEEVTEEKMERDNKTYAETTLPCFMEIAISKIPGANRGVYTKIDLPKGIVFGPYTVN